MISKFTKGKVYVFIDAANLENSVKSLKWWVDYKKLAEYFKKETHLVEIRHYCPRMDDEGQDKFFTVLKNIGIRLITKPLKVINDLNALSGKVRKANFDVEIALDALELSAKYHTLILFSGDSDFDDLFKRLRLKKKHIVVISSKYHISKELIMSCHKYIDLKKLRPYIERRRIDRRIDKKSPSFSTGG